MSNGGQESPGIRGVPGLPKPSTRAPKAWNRTMRALSHDFPGAIAHSRQMRRRIRQLKHRTRRIK